MQSTTGTAWDRLAFDLSALAGSSHTTPPADSFVLAVEHRHPSVAAQWPRRLTYVHSHESREMREHERDIGASVRAIYQPRSQQFGARALARRYDVSVGVIEMLIAPIEA